MSTGIFKQVPPANAAVGVADQLRQAILDGALSPGTRIREVEVAQQIGVSRGPVREALRMLCDEGLVHLRHNKGALVAGITPDDAVEIYAIRGALALVAFRSIVMARSDEARTEQVAKGLELLRREQLEALRNLPSGDSIAFVRAEYDFQTQLVETSGLERVSSRFAQLTTELGTLIAALKIEYPNVEAAYHKYDRMLTALQQHDYETAERQWRDHIMEAAVEFIKGMPGGAETLAERPWFVDLV